MSETFYESVEQGATENEMVGWHHQLNGPEFEQTPGDNEGQESLDAAVYGITKSWKWLGDWKSVKDMHDALHVYTQEAILDNLWTDKSYSRSFSNEIPIKNKFSGNECGLQFWSLSYSWHELRWFTWSVLYISLNIMVH